MKNFQISALVVTLMLFTTNIQSQSAVGSKDTVQYREISLNAGPFIQRYLSFGQNTTVVTDNYMLNYHQGSNNKLFRMGLGLRFDFSNKNPSDNSDRFIAIDLRLGREFRKKLNDRWNLSYGLDFITAISNLTSTWGSFTTRTDIDTNLSLGLGPILGLGYAVNNRIRLWTESSYSFIVSRASFKSKAGGSEIDSNSELSFYSKFQVPISLYLGIKLK